MALPATGGLAGGIRNVLGDYTPGEDAEINLKIKPLGAQPTAVATTAPTPQAELASAPTSVGGMSGAGEGGGGPVAAQLPAGIPGMPGEAAGLPAGPVPPYQGFGTGGASIVPVGQQVAKTNPALVTHPLGARTDDIYEAAVSELAANTQRQYMQTLGELGFMDESGNFIPGTLETEAVRQRSDIGRQREAALEQIMQDAVRGGTVFSGRRAEKTAKGQAPYDAALANLETVLGRQIGEKYGSLGDLTQQFEMSRNRLVADAAARYQASLEGGPAAGAYGAGDGGGGGGAPPPAGDMYTHIPGGEAVAGQPYGGIQDPYYQNLVNYYEQANAGYGGGAPMSKSAWLARNPGGNYANYLQAFNRHKASGGGGGGGSARVQ